MPHDEEAPSRGVGCEYPSGETKTSSGLISQGGEWRRVRAVLLIALRCYLGSTAQTIRLVFHAADLAILCSFRRLSGLLSLSALRHALDFWAGRPLGTFMRRSGSPCSSPASFGALAIDSFQVGPWWQLTSRLRLGASYGGVASFAHY